MGYSSQSGHVGIKTQASKGTYADPGAVSPNQGVFMRIRSGAMGTNRDLLVPDPEIGGNRDIADAQLGPLSFSGEYDFYARHEMIATLLYGAFGVKAAPVGTSSTGFLHTITPGDSLPWLSVEESIAGGYEVFRYKDAKVNTIHLEADADNYLMGTAGLIGLSQTPGATETDLSARREDLSPMVVGTNITALWNGVQLPAKSFSFDVNNNLEDDDFRLGSLFLGDLVEKRREVTAGVTIRPQDATLWRTAVLGSPVTTTALGQSFKDDMAINITTYEDIPGATVGVKYTLTITIPAAVIAPFNLDPSGDDVLEHDLEFRAVRPVSATPIVTAAVRNSYATVA